MTAITATTTSHTAPVPAWLDELVDALGAGSVLTDPDVTAAYARDQAMLAESGTPASIAWSRA